jgi:protein SCO1/2
VTPAPAPEVSFARTLITTLGIALLAFAAAHWLTLGFEVWTAEGARRLAWARRPAVLPDVAVEGPGVAAQPLAALLAQGGGATLVDFVYTRCEAVCAALGGVFQQAQAAVMAVPSAPRMRLLSITFDPVHDDVPALAAYGAHLQADPAVWRFARVADAAQSRLLLNAFGITVVADGHGGFEHNAALLVVDARGRLVRAFDYDDLQGALRFAAALSTTPP